MEIDRFVRASGLRCAIASAIVATLVMRCGLPSAALRALPPSARDVQEHYDPAFGGDFVRCIKAKLPEADFPVYARNLGLSGYFDPAKQRHMVNSPPSLSDAPTWWDPPHVDSDTNIAVYYETHSDTNTMEYLIWHKGYVYYLAFQT